MALKMSWTVVLGHPGDLSDHPGREFVDRGDFAGAEAVSRKALRESVRIHGSGNVDALPILDSLASALMGAGRFEEAEPVLREALEITLKFRGSESRDAFDRFLNLGYVRLNTGEFEQAVKDFSQVINFRERRVGPRNPLTLVARTYQAIALAEEGKLDQALPIFEDVLKIMEETPPNEGVYLNMARHNADLAAKLSEKQASPGMDA
ncbi:MAG: tetratricopeptide repeat protein [Deltaproteobacteria bacterium]|nr:tetratricopeptide repeat protein [Deltaproteobacteria bacterium]